MLNSVRWRLTLWYLFIFGLLLLAVNILVYTLLTRNTFERLDRSLSNAALATAIEFRTEIAEFKGDADAAAVETLEELRLPDTYTTILKDNRILVSNYPKNQQFHFPHDLSSSKNTSDQMSFHSIKGFGEEGARLGILPLKVEENHFFVVVVEPLHEIVEQLEVVKRVLYGGFAGTLLISGITGFMLAKKSLSPVVEMSEQAERIGAANLQERLNVRNPQDELGRLAKVFNELLSRLDQSFQNMREFMANASHELRTPLSIIRGEADVALSQDRDRMEYKESLAIIHEEAVRLSRIVDDLMALTRADAGQHPLRLGEFYLNDLLEEACRAMQILASSKAVSLKTDLTEDVLYKGDEDLLRRLIMNLLDNAIKYTPQHGTVSVNLFYEGDTVKITVSDTGIGIPAESVPYVFERFYRVDKARSRVHGGSGLGLSIARWVAEAHHGSIDLESTPGSGSSFTVTMPR